MLFVVKGLSEAANDDDDDVHGVGGWGLGVEGCISNSLSNGDSQHPAQKCPAQIEEKM